MKSLLTFSVIYLFFCNFSIAQNPIVQNILNDVKMDSMTFFVKQLTGEEQVVIGGVPDTIHSRQAYQPGNEKAFQFVKEKFLGYGLQVDSLQFNATGKNLLGIKIGTQYPDQKFILGAHYDNVGDSIAPGADDNASGSAAVIEAARVFSDYSFPFTVIFALWDEEELGLLGSNAYASLAASNDETILGYINMDMLGWDGNNDSTADLHVRHVASSLELASKAINANTNYNINANLHLVDPGSGNTDHASFWNNGFTAIGLNEEYDNDFNPFWHTLADSLGQFNLSFYEKVAKLVYATLGECALDTAFAVGIDEVIIENLLSHRSYPNPFSSQTTIELAVTVPTSVSINIYDGQGLLVDRIVSNKKMSAGKQQVVWDASQKKSGNYFYEITLTANENGIMKTVGQLQIIN